MRRTAVSDKGTPLRQKPAGGKKGGKQASADVKRASTCNKNTGGLRAIAPEATEENHWRTPRNSLIIKTALRETKQEGERERGGERESACGGKERQRRAIVSSAPLDKVQPDYGNSLAIRTIAFASPPCPSRKTSTRRSASVNPRRRSHGDARRRVIGAFPRVTTRR